MENKFSNSAILKKFKYDFLTILWIIVILGLTFTPGPSIPPLPQWDLISFDTFVHAFIFAVLVFLMGNAFKRLKKDTIFKNRPLFYSFIFSVLFGLWIEVIQPYIPGRTFEYYDILSNTLGAALGAFVLAVLFRFFPSDEF